MPKFKHRFTLSECSDTCRIYSGDGNYVRLDFVSDSCLRVAVYKDKSEMLPTFSVNPDNEFLLEGRERLSTNGFKMCQPQVVENETTDMLTLPCGVKIKLNKENFILEYIKDGKILFSDRAPLAYNFDGEFGKDSYHYVTRERDEYIFGLGDKGGSLNKAGRAFRIETADAMGYDAEKSDPLYKHIPFYICQNSVGCYGIFYDTSDTSYMDLGKEINNYYPAYKYFKTEDNCLVYYVFFGTRLSVLQQFARLCGKQAFPPKWSFDYCASTMAYTDAPDSEKQMNGFLDRLDEYDLSCKGFYLSSGYTSIGDRRYVFNWNYDKFPNPKAFVKKFADREIRIIPNIKPAFLDSHPLYNEIAEKGYFVKNPDGTPFVTEFWDGLGSYIDFTNPDAFDYWKQKVKETLLDFGIEATWNDNNEFDIRDLDAVAQGFGGGAIQAGRIRPNLTYLMVASSYTAQLESQPDLRPFLSTRSGNIAVRRLAQTWSGDNRTCFKDLRFCHNIGLTMSLSGLYFYGHDLGGFHGEMPSRELLLRWLQHGIFEPRFTIHSWNEDGSATMPWSYPDIMPSVKKLFAQRKRLIPYLYSCAYNAVENEIPMNAPPLLYYDDTELYAENDSMLVGTDILVPFIFDQGQNETEIYLPKKDNWYLDGKVYMGGERVTLAIPFTEEMPFFVKAGSIIPTDENKTVFTVYPVENGTFDGSFFTDDGLTFGYKSNLCVKLKFTVVCDDSSVTVKYENLGETPFVPEIRLCKGDGRRLEILQKKCIL
ncbi:MAG: TIM-barrel domain-containing protein [Eubacterium sp.]